MADIDVWRTVNRLPRFGRVAQQMIHPRKTRQHIESRIKSSGLKCTIDKRHDIYPYLDLLVMCVENLS